VTTSDVGFDPFAGPSILSAAPTTAPQREVWTGSATSQGASLSFNESVTLRFGAGVQLEALTASFTELIARHEALRSTFSNDGTTVMVTEAAFRVPFEDWSALAPAEREERLAELKAEEVETPFDLEKGPMFRAKLIQFAPDDVLAVFTAHHIVCDGWSIGVLVKDWGHLYRARVAGTAPTLPPAERFSDYARAETVRSTGSEAQVHERYWLEQFRGEIPVLGLPTDRSRPPTRSYASRRIDVPLDAELVAALKRVGVKQRASFFSTLLAGFNALLFRLSGQEDLVVGIPSAGQSVGGHDTLVGHCVNMLPVRTLLEAKLPFSELVARVRKGMLDASEHQEYTFGTLLTKLTIARDPSRPPLVSVVFNVDRGLTGEGLGFGSLPVSMSTNPRHFENFDVFVNAVELPTGLVLECQYSTPLFDEATMRRWLKSFEQLLRGAIETPDAAIGALPIVSREDEQQIAAWNAEATAPLPAELTVHALIAAQVARTPTARACVGETHTLAYADLNARANQLAHKLRALGVKKGSLVGLSVERSPSMLVGLLGILKAGAAYVPLDPGYPRDRLAFMVEDSGMQVLVTEDKPRAELALAARHVVSIDGDAVSLGNESTAELAPGADDSGPDDGAYVIYTSGSTGKPKGVLVQHSAVVNLLNSVRKRPGLTSNDVVLAVTTLSFDIAVSELILPLTVGATIVLASREVASDGGRLLDLYTKSNITFIDATPATYRLLLGAGWTGGRHLHRRSAAQRSRARARRSRRRAVERLRPHRDHRVVHLLPGEGAHRTHSHRQAGRQHADLRARRQPAAHAAGRAGRALHRGHRRLEGVPRSRRSHRRALPGRPVLEDAGRAHVQDRRRRPLLAQRRHRVPGPQRQPGEAARLPHRAR
jgi:non-ribosomal peptide synthetase component F